MAKIFVVRHGQDTDNEAGRLNGHRDTDLTELGRQQAAITAEKLKGQDISFVYVSPLKRCIQTAEIISQTAGLPAPEVFPDLIERDFGFFAGKLAADIPKLTEDMVVSDGINYFLSGEGVETFAQAHDRALKVLKQIKEKHPDQNVLLATHGDFGKMLRAAYNGWTWEEGVMTPYYANTEVITLD
jgi:probable phosphoglycerate mutase